MADRRVAITGLGVVSPLACGIEPFWQALIENRSAVAPVSHFDASKFPCSIGAELKGFSASQYVPKTHKKWVKVMAPDIEIAVAAADLAFRDSGIITKGIDPEKIDIAAKRLGCNIGAGLICSDLDELGQAVMTSLDESGKFSLQKWGASGMNNLTPLWLLKYLPNMLSCHVTIIHAAEGPSNCITCGDASGPMAIGEAAGYITRSAADVAIAGGAESKLNPMGLLRQQMLRRLCNTHNADGAAACRPFDAQHCGTVIGEGGGLLILEELSRAQGRNAKIYAEVAGFGGACDPDGIDILKPTAGGLDLAVQKALAAAKLDAKDVDLIVAHGTGVPGEDACEAAAWKSALGERAMQIPALALTGAHGCLFAGAGGVGVAAGAMAIHHQSVPPTVNFAKAATGCELNFAAQARPANIRTAVVGSFAIGGQSAAIVLRKTE